MELQIFVSLLVVLGAAFVALICDFLKGNNEKLREFNIELVTRQEERDRAVGTVSHARRSAQPQGARVAEAGKPAGALVNDAGSVQPGVSAVAEGIPANPRRRRAGRDMGAGSAGQAASNVQPPAPVAAIVAMEDWARRVVEHNASGRQAAPVAAPEFRAAAPDRSMVETGPASPRALEPAEAGLEAVQLEWPGLVEAAVFPPMPAAATEHPISSIPLTAAPGEAAEVPHVQAGLARNLPIAETVALDAGPIQPGTEPRTIEAGLAATTAGAAFEGLETATPPVEELAPPEAGLQKLPEYTNLADAVRFPALPEPKPVAPEFAEASNAEVSTSEGRAHRVQAEETLPVAEAAELPVVIAQQAKGIASPNVEPLAGLGRVELAGMPSAMQAGSFGSPRLAVAPQLPVTTAAAACEFPVRVGELQASQAETPGVEISLDSGSRMQPPDWTVETDKAAEAIEVEPELPASIVDGEMDYAQATASGGSPAARDEAFGPNPEEVVRVRVLDEGDLLQPCGLMELPMRPIAAAQCLRQPAVDGLAAWLAGPETGGRTASMQTEGGGAAMPVAGIAAEDVAAVRTGAGMAVPVPEPSLIGTPVMALPRIAFGEQAGLDFEAHDVPIDGWASPAPEEFAFEPEQPESCFPPAPPLEFEIEPVADAGYRFIEVDNEPEMNPKVVQMPLPVSAAFEPPVRAALRIPRGIHGREVFDELAQQEAPFDGVVFLAGVMGFEQLVAERGHPAVAQAIGEATAYFDSLLSTNGFGCWIEDSAFVMILPTASAEQARLINTHTAEGLWDYQLRTLGNLPLILHWGSVEASLDRLGEAVERAREQMLESGRARKQVLTASGRFRRRVVNG
ncbi:MAG: hypothetical protein C0504_06675 [Candidatus Solibacter sp.]|nr:hypothetical protein [Candidatus Solibacter sp.]